MAVVINISQLTNRLPAEIKPLACLQKPQRRQEPDLDNTSVGKRMFVESPFFSLCVLFKVRETAISFLNKLWRCNMNKLIVLIIFLTIYFDVSNAKGVIEGIVRSKESDEYLPGASVILEGIKIGTSTGHDGKFVLENIEPGIYSISASYLGFKVQKKSVNVKPSETTNITFELEPTILSGQEVLVTATRAKERETPVAFTNMSRKEIESKHWAQDIPMMLNELPNVYSYSDNGNGIGYSYMKIRGFDQRRIGVMINGVPLNDAESHEVFWVDHPDIGANSEDIQVQRGVGNSLYGASAFGGSVNLITAGFTHLPKVQLDAGYGTFNTRRFSISANSGLIDNTYNLYGRFSRIDTDGYRKPSWSKLWSYFFGVTRYDENMVTRINIFGGPEQSYLSYRGVIRDWLKDRNSRRTNPFQFPNEIDNFYQPHYQLINDWQISEIMRLENTWFVFLGEGNYTQFRSKRDVREYNIPRFKIADSTLLPSGYYKTDASGNPVRDAAGLFEVRRLDLTRKRSVDDIDYGWLPRFTFKHHKGNIILGGEYRYHSGHHFGEVTWANIIPPNLSPNWRYYDYVVPKISLSGYIHSLYQLLPELSIMTDLQIRHHNIKLKNEKRYFTEFERKYTFVTPRGGVNYNFTDELNVFANISVAKREPAFKDIYNPQDYWISPVNLPKNFLKDGELYRFVGKTLKPEKLVNYEIGSGYRTDDINLKFNLYLMDFRDEIILTGQIDDNGIPISGNAEQSVHRGVEFSGRFNIFENLYFDGNISFNDDRFIKHSEYIVTDWTTSPPTTKEIIYNNKRLGGFPTNLSNLRLTYNFTKLLLPLKATIHLMNVGRIYLDNTENKQVAISPFSVLNGGIAYELKNISDKFGVEINLIGNNLLDRLYETSGYVEEGVVYWIPAATRNFFLTLKFQF